MTKDAGNNAEIEILRSPEKNVLQIFEKLYYRLGGVTKKNVVHGFERPLSLRAERAQIFHETKKIKNLMKKRAIMKKSGRAGIREILEFAKNKDRIVGQFFDQREISVDVNGAGEQKARYANIKPKEGEERPGEPPIVVIPGAANDLSCVETLVWELAQSGREVIVIGYPDSIMGNVSENFVKRVEESQNYEAHAEFFAKALEELIPKGLVEMWGFSTGAPIIAQMLSKPELSQRVKKAVLLAPASSVDQTVVSFNIGLAAELAQVGMNYKNAPKYVWTWAHKNEDKDHKNRRERSLSSLIKKVRRAMPDLWENARVMEGGTIEVISGRYDRVTKSWDYFKKLVSTNLQLKMGVISGGHAGALLDPEGAMEEMRRVGRNNL